MSDPQPSASPEPPHETPIAMVQSLIVAFVLAMAFRSFVTEGFVIPTGSMAPQLLGMHVKMHSKQTGSDFTAGVLEGHINNGMVEVNKYAPPDPLLGPAYPGSGANVFRARRSIGDRFIALKNLYLWWEPQRYDVVVFKNPTMPMGASGTFIKRLIGLPGEATWLVDGDVFAAPVDQAGDSGAFTVQRKPEHVQREVWQCVYDSDHPLTDPAKLKRAGRTVEESPWAGEDWTWTDERTLRCTTGAPTELRWRPTMRDIDDWNPYNVITGVRPEVRRPEYVSDIRLCAAVVPDDDGLAMTYTLDTRQHEFQFQMEGELATVRMRPRRAGHSTWTSAEAAIDAVSGGSPVNVEFWHVDQSLAIYINGTRVVDMTYDWRPPQRLAAATNEQGDVIALSEMPVDGPPMLVWAFSGSPVTVHRLCVDRDLHYRRDWLTQDLAQYPTRPDDWPVMRRGSPAYATHPTTIAKLNDEQYFMLGDNSPASSDSRLWGLAHPLTALQIDDTPFVAHRKLLLGKAFAVYFSAPYPIRDNGRAFIPDFGSVRFVR